jgi:hypothetical protein
MGDKKFPLEKILNVSLRAYCESVGEEASVYKLQGVHLIDQYKANGFDGAGKSKAIENFASKVPKNAEAVVNYQDSMAYNNEPGNSEATVTISMHGTALIRKDQKKPKKSRKYN